MNVIIAGGRNFHDYNSLCETMQDYLDKDITVICGMARGADLLGRRWAMQFNKRVIEMPAKWDLHGKSAGYKRNQEMAKIADRLIAFWDGKSRGTMHMINIMKEMGKEFEVVYYEEEST